MIDQKRVGVCYPLGFRASGIAAGIKQSGKLDVALVVSDSPCIGAGVFTTNKVKAASVLVSLQHLHSQGKKAVLVSSGNANAATGEEGIAVCKNMCENLAAQIGCKVEEILIAQTGLIGIPLDRALAVNGAIAASNQLSVGGGENAAKAMMTTDTKMKVAEVELNLNGKAVKIGGMAKGAAMLAPSMATMLAVVTSDVSITNSLLNLALNEAMEDSFHSLCVDNCQSTNDTVFLLANGASGIDTIRSKDEATFKSFVAGLKEVCISLARQMAADAEGSNKFLRMEVVGARDKTDAKKAAMSVVKSNLVKCSLAGELAYWGRVIAELGASGADFNPNDVKIYYGNHLVCNEGMACSHDVQAVEAYMKQKNLHIRAEIGQGPGQATAFGCDLTHAYVDENMGKS